MSTKALSALIVTAMALVGDYSAVLPKQNDSAYAHDHAFEELTALRKTISDLNDGWIDVDSIYSSVLRRISKSEYLDERLYLSNMEHLKAIRQLEATMAATIVPSTLEDDHLALRRSIARARGRLASIDLVCRQFFVRPDIFESSVDPEGIRALADHTTQRLVQSA